MVKSQYYVTAYGNSFIGGNYKKLLRNAIHINYHFSDTKTITASRRNCTRGRMAIRTQPLRRVSDSTGPAYKGRSPPTIKKIKKTLTAASGVVGAGGADDGKRCDKMSAGSARRGRRQVSRSHKSPPAPPRPAAAYTISGGRNAAATIIVIIIRRVLNVCIIILFQ